LLIIHFEVPGSGNDEPVKVRECFDLEFYGFVCDWSNVLDAVDAWDDLKSWMLALSAIYSPKIERYSVPRMKSLRFDDGAQDSKIWGSESRREIVGGCFLGILE